MPVRVLMQEAGDLPSYYWGDSPTAHWRTAGGEGDHVASTLRRRENHSRPRDRQPERRERPA